ncbi:MAG: homocysteine S-methyltransferase family protein [Devosia sp.]
MDGLRAASPRLTDGGIETDLIFNRGQTLPLFSAFVLNESAAGREVLASYYRDYLAVAKAAGRDFVFATDTWRASSDWAGQLGYDDRRLMEANRAGIDICRDVAAEFAADGGASLIAGVIGPRRDAWVHDAAMSIAEAQSYHAPQVEALALGAVDEIHVYTLTNTAEAVGIARLAEAARLPVVLSFTVETDGRLPGGMALGRAIEQVDAETGGSAAYFMINCAHPRHFREPLESGAAWVARIGGLRSNASTKSHTELDQSPDIDIGDIAGLAEEHRTLLAALPDLQIVGGCCGTDHRHIGAICTASFPHS